MRTVDHGESCLARPRGWIETNVLIAKNWRDITLSPLWPRRTAFREEEGCMQNSALKREVQFRKWHTLHNYNLLQTVCTTKQCAVHTTKHTLLHFSPINTSGPTFCITLPGCIQHLLGFLCDWKNSRDIFIQKAKTCGSLFRIGRIQYQYKFEYQISSYHLELRFLY